MDHLWSTLKTNKQKKNIVWLLLVDSNQKSAVMWVASEEWIGDLVTD